MSYLKSYIQNIILEPSIKTELEYFIKEFENNPQSYDFLVDNPQLVQEDFKDAYKIQIQRYIQAQDMLKSKYPNNNQLLQNQHALYELSTFYLHWQAFLPTIQLLGTQEQVEYWTNLAFKNQIFGAYGQTEVGHGSDVQGLQTTAIFDKANDQFIINTPTSSAYKFWPGMLGMLGTHAVVQARTQIQQQDIGIQTFIIPIRNTQTYELLKGVEAGDIGPKLGFFRADNGYLGLNNVSIPRNNMLMRYTQIDKEGNVTKSSKNAIKYGYGSMLNLRVNLVNVFSSFGLWETTTAFIQIKQLLKTNSIENNCICFKLLRNYIINYSLIIANAQVRSLFNQFKEQIAKNDTTVNETLQFVHLFSSQMKSISAWESVKSARETLQITPFGHLNASNIINLYTELVPVVTYEGENNVLMQQTAQYLLKQFSKQSTGGKFSGIASYYNNHINTSGHLELKDQQLIIERLSYMYTKQVLEQFQQYIQNGFSIQNTWNELNQQELIKASIIFGYSNIYIQMGIQINKDNNIELQKIHKLFGLFIILENRTSIVSLGIAYIEQDEILQEIENIFGQNKLEYLEYLSTGANMLRQRNFLNLDWNKLQLKPKL